MESAVRSIEGADETFQACAPFLVLPRSVNERSRLRNRSGRARGSHVRGRPSRLHPSPEIASTVRCAECGREPDVEAHAAGGSPTTSTCPTIPTSRRWSSIALSVRRGSSAIHVASCDHGRYRRVRRRSLRRLIRTGRTLHGDASSASRA